MTDRHRRYIDQITRESSEYLQQLLAENDRLRSIIGELETEKTRAEASLREALSEMRVRESSEDSLRRRLEQTELESRAFADRYLQIEQQNANLANLYVASYQLHVTFDRQAVLGVIKEIVINLIGSEELAIYELSPDRRELLMIDSFGLDAATMIRLPVGLGLIGDVARSGEMFVVPSRQDMAAGEKVTAAIPLKVDGHIVGVLAIFRLLPQKDSLQPLDFELFDLLAAHAATALFCTAAFEQAKLRGDAA